jgi:hypothetical protein
LQLEAVFAMLANHLGISYLLFVVLPKYSVSLCYLQEILAKLVAKSIVDFGSNSIAIAGYQ